MISNLLHRDVYVLLVYYSILALRVRTTGVSLPAVC